MIINIQVVWKYIYFCFYWKVDGTAVGFMSMCANVNVDILSKCFELEPFNNLRSVPRKQPDKDEGK